MRSTHRNAHPSTPEQPGRTPRRWRRAAFSGAAVLTLGAFTAGPALAGSGVIGSDDRSSPVVEAWQQHQRRHAGGTIAAIDGTSFVVTQRDGSPLAVATSDTTVITTTTSATPADVTPGSFVTIRLRTADDGSVTSKRIDIRPAPADVTASESGVWNGWKPWRRGVVGVVESHDLTTGELTLSTADGPVTVGTTDDTKITKTVVLTVADLTIGATVKLKGELGDDGIFAASRVHVLAAATATSGVPTTTEAPAPTITPTTAVDAVTGTGEAVSPSNSRYQGIVLAIDGASFALTLRDGTVVTVLTDVATEFHNKLAPQGEDGGASIADVAVGAWVKVKGSLDGTVLHAEKVTVGPEAASHSWHDENWDDRDRSQAERFGQRAETGGDGAAAADPAGEDGDDGGHSLPTNDRSSGSKGGSGRR